MGFLFPTQFVLATHGSQKTNIFYTARHALSAVKLIEMSLNSSCWLYVALLLSTSIFGASPDNQLLLSKRDLYREIQADTLESLNAMRDPKSFMVGDKSVWSEDFKNQSNDGVLTSTNTALDLILLCDQKTKLAKNKISKIVQTLSRLDKYKKGNSEFFYWGYKKDSAGKYVVTNREVSSLDNFHLALALWVVSKTQHDEKLKKMAMELFQKLNLDPFVDPDSGLIRGAFKDDGKDLNKSGNFLYSFWGSETRSIYALGPALGLISENPKTYFEKVSKNLVVSCTRLPSNETMVKTWDGGTFQYLLPELLFNQSAFSKPMKKSFESLLGVSREQKEKKQLSFNPAFSACQIAEKSHAAFASDTQKQYGGTTGFHSLMSDSNQCKHNASDVERVVSPHAVLLLAMMDANPFANDIAEMKKIIGPNGPLYIDGSGFMDGYYVKGGRVVPDQLALDQLMSGLAIARILSTDQRSASSRELDRDPNVRALIKDFYAVMNPKIQDACKSAQPESPELKSLLVEGHSK